MGAGVVGTIVTFGGAVVFGEGVATCRFFLPDGATVVVP